MDGELAGLLVPLLFLLIPIFSIVFLGIIIGGWNERRHLRSLDRREAELAGVSVNNLKRHHALPGGQTGQMVMGQVVIATDTFKSFATKLRNLVGGEMRSAEMLMSRARREALVRLKEQARQAGAREVWNVRFGFSNIGMMQGKQGAIMIEVIAWGTAVVRQPLPQA